MDENTVSYKRLLEDALAIMADQGLLNMESHGRYGGIVDVICSSGLFTEPSFIMEIEREKWDTHPPTAGVAVLASLLHSGSIQFQTPQDYYPEMKDCFAEE